MAIVAKPTIFIPSPNVAEDHQTKNAKAIADQNAAILIKEAELDQKFKSVFENLISDSDLQQKMSANFKKLAKPNATIDIVKNIMNIIKS